MFAKHISVLIMMEVVLVKYLPDTARAVNTSCHDSLNKWPNIFVLDSSAKRMFTQCNDQNFIANIQRVISIQK